MKALIPLLLLLPPLVALADKPIVVESGPNRVAVVELYTSEGCNSCPPADRWLKELADIPSDEVDVMPLAFHVDYWDYIGWEDEFASPRFTARQRELAARNAQGSVYTPEFFVDGRETRGVYRMLSSIRSANVSPSPVKLRMSLLPSAESISINLNSEALIPGNYSARFVVFENGLSTDVQGGENSGKLLEHERVVRYLGEPFSLQGEHIYSIPLQAAWKQHNLGVGVIVRDEKQNPVQGLFSLLGN